MTTIESLHNHTTLSDGKLSHTEMFNLAESLNISVIAFTDHDAVPTPEILNEIEALRGRDTKWILGIELTTDLPHEINSFHTAVHIIGLFVDPHNIALQEHCRRAQEARIRRMEKIVESLQRLGFIITAEDCLKASGGESVGRPHIVEALKKRTENNVVIEKLRVEMKWVAERDPKIKEQYDRMIQKGESAYPYTLFLTPESFRSAYYEYDYMPTLDDGVSLIRSAGGLAILAHYHTVSKKMPMDILEKLFAEKRIDGVEVVYGLREYDTVGENAIVNERNNVRALAQKYNAIISGGSDAHRKEDQEFYASNEWFSGETNGFTANILARRIANKKFSSLD